jgi:GNAT superfamily N-acetyltransferase
VGEIKIRKAALEDAGLILGFIKELAKFEKMENELVATSDGLRESLLAEGASAKALIVHIDDEPIGYAVYFYNYSTWLGKKGIYLEDLYITSTHRGKRAGKAVLRYLAKLAVDEGCGRFEWSVLDWNKPAIKLYQSIGAASQDSWVLYRLDGNALFDFACL